MLTTAIFLSSLNWGGPSNLSLSYNSSEFAESIAIKNNLEINFSSKTSSEMQIYNSDE